LRAWAHNLLRERLRNKGDLDDINKAKVVYYMKYMEKTQARTKNTSANKKHMSINVTNTRGRKRT